MLTKAAAVQWIKQVLRYIPWISSLDWTEENCEVTSDESKLPGPMEIRKNFPYLVPIFEAIDDPKTERITLMFGTQVGKTTFLMIIMAYIICRRPGRIIYAFPTQKMAEDFSTMRWQPFLKKVKEAHLVMPENKDLFKIRTQIFKTTSIRFIAAGSPTESKSFPAKNILEDEIDDFNSESKHGQGSAEDLLDGRTKAQDGILVVKVSSPTRLGRGVSKSFAEGSQEHWRGRCPHCDFLFKAEDSNFLYDKKAELPGDKVDEETAAETVHVKCPNCHQRIGEEDKLKFIHGDYICENPKVGLRHRSFRVNSIYPMTQKWEVMMRKKVKALDDIIAERDYSQQFLALPWAAKGTNDDKKIWRKLERDYGELDLPGTGAQLPGHIVVTIDVQQAFTVWYAVWFLNAEGMWLLKFGQELSPEDVYQHTLEWIAEVNNPLIVDAMFYVDSGDQTTQVIDWCRGGAGRRPIMGVSGSQMKRTLLFIQPKPVDVTPDGKPDPNGMMRYNINSNEVKEMLFADIQRAKCRIFFYKGVSEHFYDHLVAEDRVMEETKFGMIYKWENPQKKDNHGFDLCVYAWAASHLHMQDLRELARPTTKTSKTSNDDDAVVEKTSYWKRKADGDN